MPSAPRRSTVDSMEDEVDMYTSGSPNQAAASMNDTTGEAALPGSVARSLLFTLPREIRDRIYAYCLSTPSGEHLEWPAKPHVLHQWHLAPQLLRTCRPVCGEALSVLYGSNILAFTHPSDANMLVRALASPRARQAITKLYLVVKAQDHPVWMTYLQSTDQYRSLINDFPKLRELTIRYASNKWQHTLPVEANLRYWSDDTRLNSLITGVSSVYYPTKSSNQSTRKDREKDKEKLRERMEACLFEMPPTIKMICACRIHSTHFATLTSDAPLPAFHAPVPPPPPPPGFPQAHHAPPLVQTVAAILDGVLPVPTPPMAMQEGEDFHGFTHADFKGRGTRVPRVSGTVGGHKEIMQRARTVFAKKGEVLLALEVFAADVR